jgi:hypothetical protein
MRGKNGRIRRERERETVESRNVWLVPVAVCPALRMVDAMRCHAMPKPPEEEGKGVCVEKSLGFCFGRPHQCHTALLSE